MRTVLVALACIGGAVGIAVAGLFVIVFTAGPSIAAGERAAALAGGLALLLWLGAVAAFWFLSHSAPLVGRVLGTLVLGLIAFVALGLVFLAAVVLLNR